MFEVLRLIVKMWFCHNFTVLRLKKGGSKGIRLVRYGFSASTINKICSKNWENMGKILMKVIYGGGANRVSPLNLDLATPKIRFHTSVEIISLILMHNIHMQPVPRKICNMAAMSRFALPRPTRDYKFPENSPRGNLLRARLDSRVIWRRQHKLSRIGE